MQSETKDGLWKTSTVSIHNMKPVKFANDEEVLDDPEE